MSQFNEVSPPGWSGTVKAMKKHKKKIDNPYALAWHMKKKGDKPHYKTEKKETIKKCEKCKMESFSEFVARRDLNEAKKEKWIQKAVNPEHKGFCTPMSKKTCTSKRKALAKKFKSGNIHDSHDK